MPTYVIDTIKPINNLTFPVACSNDLLGGHYQVSTLIERDDIPADRRVTGMFCYVSGSINKLYCLIGGIENSNWQEFVTGTGDGSTYVHPNDGGGSLAGLTGPVIISGITVNTLGHVTGTSTRNLTPSDIGASEISHIHTDATTSADGFMSATDKTKLDGLSNYTHPYDGSGSIPNNLTGSTVISRLSINTLGHVIGTSTRNLTPSDIGAAALSHIHSNVTTSADGFMSATDKTKLDGLSNYTLPIASDVLLGGIKVGTGLAITGDGVLSSIITSYSHPTYTPVSLTISNSGATVLSGCVLTSNSLGHITSASFTSTTLTPADIGAAPVSHDHNDLYYTKTELLASDGSNNKIDWSQIKNVPSIGSSNWLSPVANQTSLLSLTGMTTGNCVLVLDDGDGRGAQYYYSSTGSWIKIADVDYSAYTHPTFSPITINTSNSNNTVISNISFSSDNNGHVISCTTLSHALTLADLGFTGANNANYYTLPIASDSSLGGIKIGSGLSIDAQGVLSNTYTYTHPTDGSGDITTPLSGSTIISQIRVNTYGHVTGINTRTLSLTDLGYIAYTLPEASPTTLGGIKVGTGLEINSGVLSVSGGGTGYTLPTASNNTLGGIIVGDGLDINDGILSVSGGGTSYTHPTFTAVTLNIDTVNAQVIDTFTLNTNSEGHVVSSTVTTRNLTPSDIGAAASSHTHADATTSADGFMSATDKTKLDGLSNYTLPATLPATMITQDSTHRFVTDAQISNWDTTLTLPIASSSELGGVKIGAGVSISGDGTISVSTYTHPLDGSGSLADLTGSTIISGITVNTLGHITGTSTRNLTPSDIGAAALSHTHADATTSADGFMSSIDKTKLDGLSNYVLPTASATTLGGIKVGTGLTITDGILSATGGATNAFSTIAISGQNSLIADASTDTLTFVAGSNITLTTDSSTDTITISSTASGGSSGDYTNTIGDLSISTTNTNSFYLSGLRYLTNGDAINFAASELSASADITINPVQFTDENPIIVPAASLTGSGPYSYTYSKTLSGITKFINRPSQQADIRYNNWVSGFSRKSNLRGLIVDGINRTTSTAQCIYARDETKRYNLTADYAPWTAWDSSTSLTPTDLMVYDGHIMRQHGDFSNYIGQTNQFINYDYNAHYAKVNKLTQYYYSGLHMFPGTGDNRSNCNIRIVGTSDGVTPLTWNDVLWPGDKPLAWGDSGTTKLAVLLSFTCVKDNNIQWIDPATDPGNCNTWHNIFSPYIMNWTDRYGCLAEDAAAGYANLDAAGGFKVTFDVQATNDDSGPDAEKWGFWLKIEIPHYSKATVEQLEVISFWG